jgi:hypothetical protein
MTSTAWKYAFASVIGTSHAKAGLPCQDLSDCTILQSSDDSTVLVAVVADGAGSAERAEVGASLACSLFIDEMRSLFELGGGMDDITYDFMKSWFTRFRNEVSRRADSEGSSVRQYACTLLGAVVGEDCAAFVQVGDGAIVVSCSEEPETYQWMFWPQKGEYENITTFATDEAVDAKFEHQFINRRIEELAMFTDGLQHLALHYETRAAFEPFFRSMFNPLRPSPGGYLKELSSTLDSFLNSQQVNKRTDDDKTLVIATRRMPTRQQAAEDSHDNESQGTIL